MGRLHLQKSLNPFSHFYYAGLWIEIYVLFFPVYPIINKAQNSFIIQGISPTVEGMTTYIACFSFIKNLIGFGKKILIDLFSFRYDSYILFVCLYQG